MIAGGGGRIAAIAADRAEMALARAVLSTVVGGGTGAVITGDAVAGEVPTVAFLGWDAGIVLRFVVKRAMVKGGI